MVMLFYVLALYNDDDTSNFTYLALWKCRMWEFGMWIFEVFTRVFW